MIEAPGFYEMAAGDYHADPCPAPSLSSSVAKLMVDKSPRHAWTAHPRLNPDFVPSDDSKFSLGSCVHTMLLGKGANIYVVDAADWRTKAAKEQRDAAFARGETPILAEAFESALLMKNECREQLDAGGFESVYATPANSEMVIAWQDQGGVWCRAMIDWHEVTGDKIIVYDYKTTSTDSEPAALPRKIVDLSYDISASFYERGLQILRPEWRGRVEWRWVFQETKPPYTVTVAKLGGDSRVYGAKRAAAAIGLWERCLTTWELQGRGKEAFPRWPIGVHAVDYPEWAAAKWMGREEAGTEFVGANIRPMLPEPPPRPQADPELATA